MVSRAQANDCHMRSCRSLFFAFLGSSLRLGSSACTLHVYVTCCSRTVSSSSYPRSTRVWPNIFPAYVSIGRLLRPWFLKLSHPVTSYFGCKNNNVHFFASPLILEGGNTPNYHTAVPKVSPESTCGSKAKGDFASIVPKVLWITTPLPP